MIIKKIIDEVKLQFSQFESDIEGLQEKMKTQNNSRYNEFYLIIKKYKLNPRILDMLADQLQLEDENLMLQQYSLEDVENLQRMNLEVNPDSVTVLASYLHYQYLTKEAKELDLKLIDDLKSELEVLKNELNN